MTSSTKPIEELVLELQNMPVSELVPRYVEAFGKPPRNKNRAWLWHRLAWEEQARRYGGLSGAAKKRIAEIQVELQLPDPPSRREPVAKRSGDPPAGTRLEREWHGKTIVAVRVDGGWEVDGAVHRSLSAAANAVTGSHCNGRAFFGLATPGGGR
jgi:hypothetical protein